MAYWSTGFLPTIVQNNHIKSLSFFYDEHDTQPSRCSGAAGKSS
jgi:hypothetical protein